MVVAGLLASGRFVRMAPQFALSAWGPFLALSAPFAVANVLNLAYLRADQILLEEWGSGGFEAVAWYTFGYTWVAALGTFPGALMGAAFPRFASLTQTGGSDATRGKLANLYTQTWKVVLATGVPAALFIAICGGRLTRALYPTDIYPPGTIDASFRAMALYAALLFPATIISHSLRAANRWKAVIVLVCVALVVNVGANAWAMPRYGHVGAAWARGASELVYVGLGVGYSLRHLSRLSEYRFLPRLAAACLGLAGVLLALAGQPLWMQMSAGAAAYVALVLLFRPLRRADLNFGGSDRPSDRGASRT